ncbi:MAG TPA: GNAT family N-acetyltransferase [Mucilaginibacter sp.]|nr:GNAT family N-acetyltransferase [Mucilaginibacter sp.]
MIFPPFTNLTTERLFLRELQPADAEQIFKIRSDARVNEFVDRTPATSIEDGLSFINQIITNQNKREGIMWAITLKDNPKLIGTIVYWHIVKEKDEAEIGYEMLPDYFGKGIMQEALLKVIEFGFGTMELKTILADTKADNLRSINLLEKCGFVKTDKEDGEYLIYSLSIG